MQRILVIFLAIDSGGLARLLATAQEHRGFEYFHFSETAGTANIYWISLRTSLVHQLHMAGLGRAQCLECEHEVLNPQNLPKSVRYCRVLL